MLIVTAVIENMRLLERLLAWNTFLLESFGFDFKLHEDRDTPVLFLLHALLSAHCLAHTGQPQIVGINEAI